ncbi:MAG: FGGY-family carbohydrate kinase [Deltaproteobacteria bacterium]|nr:FGGY-family carbohydrate kinase [Deltaproteobacteria bacterium]MBW2049328.1 FGGY-family carbohydrate kinase [Deltaproteobacteria bacterium]MBW2112435.1 FGGY-family carbohydrate kinase [Deltaproteobacteria bacterium]MBW2354645.1 FGGY-family carbohydrate kinase [Deltaproteobacteria bacterium]HDZ90220.1 carbohydrate kinase [Deltaproteobacteria bacterium]
MNTRDLILTIDNGTLSLKALIFDPQGELLAKERVAFKPYYSKHPGWAEQDPDLFWGALCTACQRIWKMGAVDRTRIAGVGITTQRGTVINVDRGGRPLRPAILWLDQRKTRDLDFRFGPWSLLFKVAGLKSTVAYFQAEAEANWIHTNQRDIWERTHKYLLLSGYLTYRLTGEFKDSVGCQVGYLPFDYRRLKWARNWDWKWRCLPVRREMLPELVPPGQVLGYISESASDQTGIPAGLPLIAAGADKACEVIGSGSLDPSVGCLSFGTTATINITSKKYVEPIPMLPPYPSAMPGFYTVEVQVYRGYWMVNWFKEQFGHPEKKEALKRGVEPEQLFERLLEKIPPSSMGLVLQPYWTPGLKSPGPEAKGAIIGFGDVHTRAHLYRAILEGLAFALREGKERIEKRGGTSIKSLRVSGGGSQSDRAMQLTADVFGLPAARPHLYETSGLGAAVDVAAGLGLHRDFRSAVKAMTRVSRVFEPDPANFRLYDALYCQVYKKMYRRLRPLYEKIREITGYPDG